jgi:hypothetical protein
MKSITQETHIYIQIWNHMVRPTWIFPFKLQTIAWCGVIYRQLIGLLLLRRQLQGAFSPGFLELEAPAQLEDVALKTWVRLYFHLDTAPPRVCRHAKQSLNHHFPGCHCIRAGDPQNWPPWSPDLRTIIFSCMGYPNDLVYERKVDKCEDLIFWPVDETICISDFSSSCYTFFCETSVGAEGEHQRNFTVVKPSATFRLVA